MKRLALVCVLLVTTLFSSTVSFAQSGVAPTPTQARLPDTWTAGDKLGMGTAYTYDQPAANNPSTVWFTITGGAITDVTYPTIDQANVKTLALMVTDGKTFTTRDDDPAQTSVALERLDGRSPAYKITVSANDGNWQTVKEVLTDPKANTLVVRVRLIVKQGNPADYQLYAVYQPHLAQSGRDDASRIDQNSIIVSDQRQHVSSALIASPAPLQATVGYTDTTSDFTEQLAKTYKLDTTYDQTDANDGYVMAGMQLTTDQPVTLALGLGASDDEAANATANSLKRGFDSIATEYESGWTHWLDSLKHPANADPLYEWSAVVLKAHMDKLHPGAAIASIAAPWGDTLRDNDLTQRGYRFVWIRDLYHAAMGLFTLGDTKAARQILGYMLLHIAQENGSVPQNQFVNGDVHWTGIQLDEVADPLILAWQLGATDVYTKLKPLADFVATRGPSTQQERWEENDGYSPATLAAEIAGLVCAADLAKQSGDTESAQKWLATADNWNSKVEEWTFTTHGTLSGGNYYLRITQKGNPDASDNLTIQNGGGTHDQRDIVDPSFLEPVRLGVRSPSDPHITQTLPVIDATIRVSTPKGDAFHRYPFDGYGEQKPGDPYNGKGHAWPLLAGERGVYEVLAGQLDQAKAALDAMRAFANPGGMIPEQVYETTGDATGSAAPLVWAHAEYIILANAIASGSVLDRPKVVYDRYGLAK